MARDHWYYVGFFSLSLSLSVSQKDVGLVTNSSLLVRRMTTTYTSSIVQSKNGNVDFSFLLRLHLHNNQQCSSSARERNTHIAFLFLRDAHQNGRLQDKTVKEKKRESEKRLLPV
jgi:hypothetical protein